MSIIVRDDGFHADDAGGLAIEIASDTHPEALPDVAAADLVSIAFPVFSDGRGFTLARILRAKGYTGRLRAKGHMISDQYAMARRSGFDEVEISEELAARQPAEEWRFRANWKEHDYRSRVRG